MIAQGVQFQKLIQYSTKRILTLSQGVRSRWQYSYLSSVAILTLALCPLTGAVDSASEVYGYLQRLWAFMRQCSIQLFESTHLCCCVSRVSGEQDDDMIEAAKALLSIFLHQRYNCQICEIILFSNLRSLNVK